MAYLVRSPQPAAGLSDRWDPAREMGELHTQMERLLGDVWAGAADADGAIWVPRTDIEETEDAWIVEAELPGAKAEDVNIEATDSELVITGEIVERERKGILRRRTRRTGRFEYRVTLPGEADPDAIQASLDGGVLTLRIPKPQQTQPRRIEVQPGAGGERVDASKGGSTANA
jgi:HSP20 family protein